MTIRGCQIVDNFAPRGGGIAIVDAIDVILDDCVVERNEAGTIDTAITVLELDAAVTAGEIERFDITIGDAHGGGIYLENSEQVFIRNSHIKENKAILFGGGIAVDNRAGFDGGVEIADNEVICNQVSHGDLAALQHPAIDCSVSGMGDPVLARMEDETLDRVAAAALALLHGVGVESGLGGGIALRHVSPQTRLLRNRIGVRLAGTGAPNRAGASNAL